ncbi:MAG TPA: hypothetical protein VGE79_04065 [Niastella sp.]
MNRITTEYKKREGVLVVTSQCVIEKLDNNPDFPDPPEALDKLKKAVPELSVARVNARGRDKHMVAIKNNIKAVVLELLQELADYVTTVSNGNRTMMLSSGFNVSSENGSGKQKPTIEKVEVDLKVPGEATIRTKNVANAIAFVHQYTTEPPTAQTKWYGEGSSLGRYTFKGLESEKRHWFRVVAIGYFGLRGYSPIVSMVIQ